MTLLAIGVGGGKLNTDQTEAFAKAAAKVARRAVTATISSRPLTGALYKGQ